MKILNSLRLGLLAAQVGLAIASAQPVIIQPGQNPMFQSGGGNGFSNLRVTHQSEDGTEATLTMEYSYDGSGGPSARIAPVIVDRKNKEVSKWFGADSVTIGQGHG